MFQKFDCYDPCSSYCSPCRSQRMTFFFYFILFYLFIYFTLQYCIGSAMHWLESTMGAHVFPIPNPPYTSSPSHPSGSSQYTSPEYPVSCIEPGLAIRFTYDNLHVSMPLSKYHPALALSHRVQKTVLYICVSFAVSHTALLLPSF